jgi:hypothetical protein
VRLSLSSFIIRRCTGCAAGFSGNEQAVPHQARGWSHSVRYHTLYLSPIIHTHIYINTHREERERSIHVLTCTSYTTRDLASADDRFAEYNFDRALYVVDAGQVRSPPLHMSKR